MTDSNKSWKMESNPKIIIGYPPNIDEIDKVLHVKGRDTIIYTYGDTIYVPGAFELTQDLIDHEMTHVSQQSAMGADEWWDRYLKDVEFRIDQEVEAYKVQLSTINATSNRKVRREAKSFMASTLASNMYGNMLTKKQAERLLDD